MITIGVDGEKWDECENDEESYVDDVLEARVEDLAGYLKMQVYCRTPVAKCGSHTVIKTRWVDTMKRRRSVFRNSLPVGGEGGEETQQHGGGERELLRIHSTS